MRKTLSIQLFLTFFFYAIFVVSSQEIVRKGAHELQIEKYGSKNKNIKSKYDISGKGIIPLEATKTKDLTKIVFGFLPEWEYNSGAHNNIHYDLLTHLAVFNFLASSDGSLQNPPGWPWTDVINAAHANNTKVVLAITNFGGAESAASVAHTLMTNASSKNALFNNIKNLITTYQLDGVNIDFETMDSSDRGSILNTFMSELTSFIHTNLPGKEVSFDGPAVNWSGWDLDGLAQSVDHIFIMAYDYNGSFSSNTGAVAPLVDSNPSNRSVTRSLNDSYSVPKSKYPEKLILGVPYYGKHWKTATSNAGSSINSYVGSTFYRNTVTEADNYGGFIWDTNSETPWYKWNSGGWNQVWADNEQSLEKKYDLALTEDLGGIGIWALNYDGNRTELWDLINTKFNGNATPSPSAPQSLAAIQKNETTITLKFEAGNYATSYVVYQSTDNSNFTIVKEDSNTIIDITGLQENEVYYFKVESKNEVGVSSKTDVLAAMPSIENSEILIVDGVERRSFDAIVQYDYPLTQLGYTFSSASNEAIMNAIVDLKNYRFVIWMLLDDSTVNDTFSKSEQAKVTDYIDNNGTFIVSGNEIGWDLVEKGDSTDKLFYENYFKAEYIADLPNPNNRIIIDNNNQQYTIDDNSHGILDNEFPDVIKAKNGSHKTLSYNGVSSDTGYAGVSYRSGKGGVEYIAFAIESVFDDIQRKDLINYILQKYAVFELSAANFTVQGIGETCPDKDNGKILISAAETYDYVATISGTKLDGTAISISDKNFTDNLSLENLEPGNYTICILITNENYEQCFSVEIKEGVTVSGKSSVALGKASIEIDRGTKPFVVFVNGIEKFKTSASKFSVAIKHGDFLEVKTSKSCEGTYAKTVELLDGIVAYPNPTKGKFEISIPVLQDEVKIEVYNLQSQLISTEIYPILYGKVQLNIENQPSGIYLVKVHLNNPVEFKILKE
ncbi:glycosyl hydrolase family 18 protein [Lutibacter sp.]